MADLIKMKGGAGTADLAERELAYHTAEKALYIGTVDGNKRLCGAEDVSELQKQIDELQAYKNGIEMSKKSEILEGARDSIENEQYQAIKAQFEKLTPEEVEKEVAFAIYKNGATFQKTTKSSGIKTVDFNVKTDYGYGSANALFHK